MTRPPKRRWKDPAKRAELAVQFRQKGWSLRRIAAALQVSHETVRSDLARFEQSAVADLLSSLDVKSGPQSDSRFDSGSRS